MQQLLSMRALFWVKNMNIIEEFTPLFAPKTVAVIGASTKGNALPNVFIRRIREFGFSGDIYPIHPAAAEIDGLTAYKTLADTPKPVDALPCASMSRIRTVSPTAASAVARLIAVVVLPTPPFWFATAMTRVFFIVAWTLFWLGTR